MDPPEVGAVADDCERNSITERRLGGLGLVGRVRGDLLRLSPTERDLEDLEEAVRVAVQTMAAIVKRQSGRRVALGPPDKQISPHRIEHRGEFASCGVIRTRIRSGYPLNTRAIQGSGVAFQTGEQRGQSSLGAFAMARRHPSARPGHCDR